jgi:demethylmenaquinone methyltransferase/2-methoxy-6-polyprenyl-1,4-benzoquinol methylase/phosphoethanolamine N-methyltransferase
MTVKLLTLGQDGAFRRATVERAGVKAGDRVLDVGCGTGDLTLAAGKQAGPTGQVVGIDAAPEMIEVAQRKAARTRANVVFRAELIEGLSFPDQTFDVVLSSLMMHHLPGDLKRRGLAEIRRVLKPGGRVFVVDFKGRTGRGGHWSLAALFHPQVNAGVQELLTTLSDVGFVQVTSGDMPLPMTGFVTGQTPQEN